VIDRACRMRGGEEDCIKFFVVQLEEKRSVGRLTCRWEVTKLSWGLCTMKSSQAIGFVNVELVSSVSETLFPCHQELK
jgi:hypothetical protein